jgi:hypothetical protein
MRDNMTVDNPTIEERKKYLRDYLNYSSQKLHTAGSVFKGLGFESEILSRHLDSISKQMRDLSESKLLD